MTTVKSDRCSETYQTDTFFMTVKQRTLHACPDSFDECAVRIDMDVSIPHDGLNTTQHHLHTESLTCTVNTIETFLITQSDASYATATIHREYEHHAWIYRFAWIKRHNQWEISHCANFSLSTL